MTWTEQLVLNANQYTRNAFCPTGEGGGIDPTCSPGETSGGIDSTTPIRDLPVFHGGSGREGDLVTYYTQSKAMAASYVGMYDERVGGGGSIHESKITITKPASWNEIKREAVKAGVDPDAGTPASVFDDNIHGTAQVRQVLGALRSKGYDGAILEDIGYGAGLSGKAYIKFTPPPSVVQTPSTVREPKLEKTTFTQGGTPKLAFKWVRDKRTGKLSKIAANAVHNQHTRNAFCPTGEGGGVDPTCSPGGSGGGIAVKVKLTDREIISLGYDSLVGEDKAKDAIRRRAVAGDKLTPEDTKVIIHDVEMLADFGADPADVATAKGLQRKAAKWRGEKATKKGEPEDIGKTRAELDAMAARIKARDAGTSNLAVNASRQLASNVRPVRLLDPTRSSTLRQAFARKIRRKFRLLKGAIYKFVVQEDALGMEPTKLGFNVTANAPRQFAFKTTPEKLKEFQDWLRQQFKGTLTGKSDEELWKKYVQEGFKKGAGRAFEDTRVFEKAAGDKSPDFYDGSKQEFLRSAFGRPETKEKVQLLAGRSFDDLKNVTEDMATRMGRTLADGLVQGKNPREVAKDLDDDLEIGRNRAELIARTEIIRAHSEGQLDSFDALGVEEVGVAVEWSTAGDERVCPECEQFEGMVLKVDEAHGMIPAHPNCRCAWLPANVAEDREDQIRSKSGIERALERGLAAVGKTEDDYGPNVPISKGRPEGIFGNVSPELFEFSRNVSYFAECERNEKGWCLPGTGEAVDVGSDIKAAALALSRGAKVKLDQPDQVSTLLDKMHKMVQKAVEKGENAPKFDLCNVSVQGSNLFCQDNIGIPRVKMPQMRGTPEPGSEADALPRNKVGKVDVGDKFVQHMRDSGIKVDQIDIRASHLRASQNEIDGARIAQLVTERSADDLRKRPIFVTRDNYVVDGHHHWAALVGKGAAKDKDYKVPVYKLDTDIGTALHMANDYVKKVGIKPKSVPKDSDGKLVTHGGAGSGNFGHAGRPGEVGGSAPGEGGGGGKQVKASVKGLLRAFDPVKAKVYNKLLHEQVAMNKILKGGNANDAQKARAAEIKNEVAKIREDVRREHGGKMVGEKQARPQGPKPLKEGKLPEIVDVEDREIEKEMNRMVPQQKREPAQPPQNQPAQKPIGVVSPETAAIATGTPLPGKDGIKSLGGGMNGSYLVKFDNGAKGVFKPLEEEAHDLRPGTVPNDTSYKRESAAYSVARVIGMDDLVPPTITREIKGRIGSVQEFQEGAVEAMALRGGNQYDGEKDLARSAAYDFLVGHSDRHEKNWMLRDGKLRLIDNGLAFPVKIEKDKYDANWGNRRIGLEARDRGLKVPDEVAGWNGDGIAAAMRAHGLEEAAVKIMRNNLAELQKRQKEGRGLPRVKHR